MAINKVVIGENTVMDISTDTLEEASSLPQNVTAHNKNGELITGTATKQSTETIYISDIEQTPPSLSGPLYVLPECEYTVDLDPTERDKLVSGNIKKDITILGVPGTYDPLEDKEYCVSGSLADKSVVEYHLVPSITSIGSYTFYGCSSLADIDLSNITSIGISAFFSCSSLTDVDLLNVTSVGNYAFYGCSSLTDVDASRTTSVGNYTFSSCRSLENIDISSATSIGNFAFQMCTSLTSVDASSTTSVGNEAFQMCTSLTSVDISSVTTIGHDAFQSCESLTSIDISSATSIGYNAFSGCINLTNIQVKNGVKITPYTYLCRIATINGHLYYQKGTDTNNIYCDNTTTSVDTLDSTKLTFTDTYGVTFTRTSSSTDFTITW